MGVSAAPEDGCLCVKIVLCFDEAVHIFDPVGYINGSLTVAVAVAFGRGDGTFTVGE